MKRWGILAVLVAVVVSLTMWAGRIVYSGKEVSEVKDYTPWEEAVINTASAIPVHNGDRIKPLSTYAKVLTVRMHGDTSIEIRSEQAGTLKIKPVEVLLDALFRPAFSRATPLFEVNNTEILNNLGMETKSAAGHYSYDDLMPYRQKMIELATGYEQLKKDGNELEIAQSQTLDLARNVRNYEIILTYFNFARAGIVLPKLPGQPEDAKPTYVATSAFMTMTGEIQRVIQQANANGQELPEHLLPVLDQLRNHVNDAKYGPIFLAPNDEELMWTTVGEGLMNVFQGIDPEPGKTIESVRQLEDLYLAHRTEEKSFLAELQKTATSFQDKLTFQQKKNLLREVDYNQKRWFFAATFLCFLPAMIFIVISWLTPTSIFGRIMGWATVIFSSLGLVLSVLGIVQRSLIMDRPPVGNLYDTIIFIGAGVVFIALFTELFTKRKVALGVSPFIGFFLFALAHMYDIESKEDNMEPLIAVLRSNFWLTVHVPVITLGYAAGLAAWLFGIVYTFVRLFKLDQDDPSLRRLITRMTYGSVCFCLLLSLIGTVTGGIWANDSWGRFWGWDPKENGALMIVLWMLFILHARLGGIIKEWGIHLAAIFTGPVVVFSWWHVNLLGVGLHSYGFSDSKADAVNAYYYLNVVLLLIGGITAFIQTGTYKRFLKSPEELTSKAST